MVVEGMCAHCLKWIPELELIPYTESETNDPETTLTFCEGCKDILRSRSEKYIGE